jgi:hypothetical protein
VGQKIKGSSRFVILLLPLFMVEMRETYNPHAGNTPVMYGLSAMMRYPQEEISPFMRFPTEIGPMDHKSTPKRAFFSKNG